MMTANQIPIESFEWNRTLRSTKRSHRLVLNGTGTSDGEEAFLPVLEVAGKEEGPALLILACVHGDEYEGIETILRLFHNLDAEEISGSVLLIPVANPYAYRGGTRVSPEDQVNLARAFPGKADGSLTERLANELHHRFIKKADFLLDLHSGGTHYAVATLAGFYHNEGTPFGRTCRAAAEAFGAELLWAHSDIAPGRSISSAQELGIPWLYTEAYGGKRVRREDLALFYDGTLRLMRHLRMIESLPNHGGVSKAVNVRKIIYGDGNFDNSAVSAAEGFFIPDVNLLDEVEAGDRIGTIYHEDGTPLQEVLAGRNGMVVMLPGTPVVRKNEPLYMVAPLGT